MLAWHLRLLWLQPNFLQLQPNFPAITMASADLCCGWFYGPCNPNISRRICPRVACMFLHLVLISFTQMGHAPRCYALLELAARHSPSLSSSVTHPFSAHVITASGRPSWLRALPTPEEREGPDILDMLGSCLLHPAVFLLGFLASPTSVSEFKEMTFSPWHQRTEEGEVGKCIRGCFRHWKRKSNAPAIFVLHSLGRKEHTCTGCRTREQARIKFIMDYVSLTPKFIGITPNSIQRWGFGRQLD